MFSSRLNIVKHYKIFSKKSVKLLNFSHDFTTTQISYDNYKDKDNDHLNVSLFSIKKTLKSSNYQFTESFTNIKTLCPVCESSSKEDIYINKITGNFICPKCNYGGKFGLIEKFFNATRNPKALNELKTYHKLFQSSKEEFKSLNNFQIENYYETFQPISDETFDHIFTYFQIDSKISKSAFTILNVRFNSITNELLFPLTDVNGQVVGCKIVSKNDQNEINEQTYPDLNCSGLVIYEKNLKSSKDKESSKKAIIVLNIWDLLALTTTRINAAFICLPYKLKSLPQECLPALDKYDELTLWFNYNTAGWDVARNFAKKLDEKRCKFVRPMTNQPTPYKALINQIEIKGILNKSQPILHKAITTFSSLRQDVLSDLQNIDKVQGVKWKRYPTLNKYLKGHRKGELTILTGPTGCGKTTFMSDYSLDLAMQGVNTLWGSFEIRNTRLATTLLRQYAGKPLLDDKNDESLVEFERLANEFENLPIYFMTFHGEQAIKVVMEAIEHATYVHDISHVIIDNVQFMMGISEESKHLDRFWKQDAIIASFRTFATRKNCHVTLVIHPRKEKDSDDLTTSSIFGGAKATQEADNVLIIQDKRLTSVRGKKYLQIAKNRYSGDLGILPLDFDKMSLSYAQKPKKKLEENSEKPPEVQNNSEM